MHIKQFSVVFVVLGALVAAFVYLNAPKQSVISPVVDENSLGEPRLVFEDFQIFRYSGEKLTTYGQGKIGHFIEPNIVEIFGTIQGNRDSAKGKESMSCEAVHVQLEADSLVDLLGHEDPKMIYAEVEDNVVINFREETMHTERAQYYFSSDQLVSREPVEVLGVNRQLFGEEGFSYNLKNEVLRLHGNVRGQVRPEAFKKQSN